MKLSCLKMWAAVVPVIAGNVHAQSDHQPKFPWPEGKKMALSLSFDDARATNVTEGTRLFDKYGAKVTFYIVPSNVQKDLEGWKRAVAGGHEMGNHSVYHPCSGNFTWSRTRSLETMTLDEMRAELLEANRQIKELLGVTPVSYAYPCGQSLVGRGKNSQSFVPVISELFLSGRGWKDEAPVDPAYCDMAKLTGMEMDGKDFEEIKTFVDQAGRGGQWLILAGHETAESGNQTSRLAMLEKLIRYAQDPANGIWLAPVGTVARYVQDKRDQEAVNMPQTLYPKAGKEIVLSAVYGKGVGPGIAYMPEWKAFGWFGGKDRVEWDVEVPQGGKYDVLLDWSVSDEESGKPYVLRSGKASLKGTVAKSGSWETFKEKKIGTLQLAKGRNKVVFEPEAPFEKGALLDLRKIRLIPAK